MAGWSHHSGQMLALPIENIDTDQLIPARFMSVPRAEGYGDYLLHDMRRDIDGQIIADMPLNRHPGASILVTGRNFGGGSSREAAVYALVDAGFRAVIAPGFGDIFAGNAVNNGLLPAKVSPDGAERLIAGLAGGMRPASVDLAKGEIILEDQRISFDLDATWRLKLINGWDDIDLTHSETDRITEFQGRRQKAAPWVWI